jgi:hypothetical protein
MVSSSVSSRGILRGLPQECPQMVSSRVSSDGVIQGVLWGVLLLHKDKCFMTCLFCENVQFVIGPDFHFKICFGGKDLSELRILELLSSGGFFVRELPTLALNGINDDSARNYHLMEEFTRGMVIPPGISSS